MMTPRISLEGDIEQASKWLTWAKKQLARMSPTQAFRVFKVDKEVTIYLWKFDQVHRIRILAGAPSALVYESGEAPVDTATGPERIVKADYGNGRYRLRFIDYDGTDLALALVTVPEQARWLALVKRLASRKFGGVATYVSAGVSAITLIGGREDTVQLLGTNVITSDGLSIASNSDGPNLWLSAPDTLAMFAVGDSGNLLCAMPASALSASATRYVKTLPYPLTYVETGLDTQSTFDSIMDGTAFYVTFSVDDWLASFAPVEIAYTALSTGEAAVDIPVLGSVVALPVTYDLIEGGAVTSPGVIVRANTNSGQSTYLRLLAGTAEVEDGEAALTLTPETSRQSVSSSNVAGLAAVPTQVLDLRSPYGVQPIDWSGKNYEISAAPALRFFVGNRLSSTPTLHEAVATQWVDVRHFANAGLPYQFNSPLAVTGAAAAIHAVNVSTFAYQFTYDNGGQGFPPWNRTSREVTVCTPALAVGRAAFVGDAFQFERLDGYTEFLSKAGETNQILGASSVPPAGYFFRSESSSQFFSTARQLIGYGVDATGDLIPEMIYSVAPGQWLAGPSGTTINAETAEYTFTPVGYADGGDWTTPSETADIRVTPIRAVDRYCGTDARLLLTTVIAGGYQRAAGVLKVKETETPVDFYCVTDGLVGFASELFVASTPVRLPMAREYSLSHAVTEAFLTGSMLNAGDSAEVVRTLTGGVHYLRIGLFSNETFYGSAFHVAPLKGVPSYAKFPQYKIACDETGEHVCVLKIDGNRMDKCNAYLKALRACIAAGTTYNTVTLDQELTALETAPAIAYGMDDTYYGGISAEARALTSLVEWRTGLYDSFKAWSANVLRPAAMLAAEAVNAGELTEADLDEIFDVVATQSYDVVYNDLLADSALPAFGRLRKNLLFAQ